jgi:hypothetical protein
MLYHFSEETLKRNNDFATANSELKGRLPFADGDTRLLEDFEFDSDRQLSRLVHFNTQVNLENADKLIIPVPKINAENAFSRYQHATSLPQYHSSYHLSGERLRPMIHLNFVYGNINSILNNLHNMRKLLVFIFLMYSSHLSAQFEKINRKKVQDKISDSTSLFYYPRLVERLNNNDTTLSGEEYRLLYYGFALQKEYSGYADHRKKEMVESINGGDYQKAIELANETLKEIPVSLSANYYKGYAMFKQDSSNYSYTLFRNKYYQLRKAIISSGDGFKCETAFKTIFVADEYDVMYNYFEIPKHFSQSLVYPCDRFKIEPSQYYKNDEIYFDTSDSFQSFQKTMEPIGKPGKKNKKK